MKMLSLLCLLLCVLPAEAQTTATFIPLQSSWRYLDNGSNQGTVWRELAFDDALWSQGGAELGYGDNDEVTTVSFGPSSTAKYITTYFRKRFTVTGAAGYTTAQLRVRRDDGVVVYLNGTEVFRSNMPAGTVTSATLAPAAVSGADEAALFSGSVNPLLLAEGTNVIAAEIHQNVASSSDLSFDLEFTGTIPGVIPAANAQTVTVTEDVAKAVTLTGSDPNGDPLSYVVGTPPVKGVLSGTPPALTYTPNLNANGADSFTFTVSDGVNVSPSATVTVNIAAVNDLPVAEAGAQTVAEDSAVSFSLTGGDVESTFGMLGDYVQQMYNGNLTAVTDGLSGATYNEDTGTLFLIRNVSGGAGHSYEYTVDGTHLRTITQTGFVDTEAIAWMYGSTFAIAEENDNQRISIVTIAPGATTLDRTAPGNVTWSTPVGSLLNLGIESMCYDAGRDVLYYLTEKPSGGTWKIWKMNPQTGVSTEVCDLFAGISTAGLATDLTDMAHDRATDTLLLLSHESSKIIRVDFTGAVLEQRGFTTALTQAEALALTSDRGRLFAGGEPKQFARYALPVATLSYSIVSPPAHGTVSGVPPRLQYAPSPDYHGPDSFTFRLFDGTDYSAPAAVSLTVLPVHDAPVGAAVTASAEATEPTLIPLPVSDTDGDALTIQTTAPEHGTLTVDGITATYTGGAGYTGADAFTYTVSDGMLTAGPFTVSLTVLPFNFEPVAAGQTVSLDEDTPVNVTLAATDAESQPLTWTIVTPPAHGTLSGTAPVLLFTPAADYHGADSFSFRVSDGQENSNTATVSLTVAPVNDAPVAVAGIYSVEAGAPLPLTLSGSDVDGDAITLAIADQPAHGVLTGTPPNVTYTADISFAGSDTFTYTASDGLFTSPPATVTVNVTAFNEPPVAVADSVTTGEDTPAAVSLSASDAESALLTYEITDTPAHGTLSGVAPALTYTPAANYSGADSFTWTAHDGAKTSAPAVFSITVTPVNDAPAANALSISTRTDTPVAVTLSGTDIESNPLTFSIESPPQHGTLSGTPPALTYTPAAGYAGPDSFTYLANDGALNSYPATVSISITAPVLARGPYVQMTAPDRATVRWRTDVPALSTLNYGTAEGALTGAVSGTVLKTSHELQVTGLSPDTRYYYSVGNPVLASGPTYYFTTHPPADTVRPYRFWVLGDAGTGTATQTAVRDTFYTYNGATKVDGVLLLGDNAYETGTDTEYQTRFFNIYPTKLRNTVFWPCFGNHDAGSASSGTQTGVYYSNFTMPKLAESGGVASGTAAYYSFDYGNIHFVCLDSEGSSRSGTGAMAQWLQADLSANWRDWTVAFWHHPPYSKGNHDSDNPAADSGKMKDMREIFVPILESFGVDLLLFGHEHAYFRSQFVDGHYGTSNTFNAATMLKQAGFGDPAVDGPYLKTSGAHSGAVFTVAGSSGKQDVFTRSMPVLALALNEAGSVVLDVNGRQLTSRFLNSTGVVRDTFSILHNDPPALAAAAFSGPEDAPLSFSLTGTDADGDALTYEIITAPAVGTLTGTAPNLVFTPTADFHGPVSFEARVNDGRVNSANATITLHITPENDAPVAAAQSLSGTEDTALSISLTGADLDGDELSFSITTPPAHGTLTGPAPDLVYTPAANWHGSDAFSFTVNDGALTSAPAEVTLAIAAVNDAPLAAAVVAATTEDTAVNLTLSGTDADNDALSYVVTSLPAHGTLSGTLPALTYLPAPDWHGADSFVFIASDGTEDSAPAVVSITVSAVNDTPAALPQTLTTAEDAPLALTLSGTDTEGSPLSYAITVPPAHGVLSGTAPDLTFTPAADFAGSDEFQFTVNDGELTSVPATITLTVTPVNDAPVAVSASATTTEDTAAAVVLSGTDTEGDPLSCAITTPPAHGTLSGTPPELTYTPDADFYGIDSFEFTVSDGAAVSAPAAVTLTISAVNDQPLASGQTLSLPEDGTIAVTLSGLDVENDPLTYVITTPPAHGSLTGTAPELLYTPDANFHGADSIAFTVNDGSGASLPAVVSLTITPVNDAPTATPQSVTTGEDTALPVVIAAEDTEDDTLTFAISAQPLHGTLSGSPPNLIYTPDPDWNGTDSFGFKASDGTADSAEAIIIIEVTAANDLPIAMAQSPATTEDTPLPLTLTASDMEGEALSFVITLPPQHGTLSGTAPDLTYTPDMDFHGTDGFEFAAADTAGPGFPAAVIITVNSVNDAPLAHDMTVETTEDTAVNVTLTGSDVDGDTLSFAVTTPPAHGTLTGTAPDLTYTPDPDYHGADMFSFTASDAATVSEPAVVSIEVSPVNDPPAPVAQSLSGAEDIPEAITLIADDPENDPLTFTVTDSPAHGTLTGTAPDLTYTPDADWYGSDSFSFTVNDGALTSAPAIITLSIAPANDAPLAAGATVETAEDTAVNVTLSGTDVDGDTLSYVVTALPVHGSLSGTLPALTYLPDPNWNGTDSFSYIVSDGTADSAPAVVSITVTPVNDPPAALAQTLATAEDSPLTLELTGADAEESPLSFAVTVPPAHGTLSGTAPNLTYTPAEDFSGTDAFQFSVNDGELTSVPATVTITITPENDAPLAVAASVSTAEDTAVSVLLVGTDIEGDALTFVITAPPAHGTLSGTAPDLTYTPDADFYGSDSFQFTVSDGAMVSPPAAVALTISAVNDSPHSLAQAISVAEDEALALALRGADTENDALTFTVATPPEHGTLSGTAPDLTYTPDADFHGTDGFTFTVHDGELTSAPAAVSITVLPVNDAPSASALSAETAEDTAVNLALSGTDIDGDTLSAEILTQPANGTLTGESPSFTYTPDANWYGTDSFTFRTGDGLVFSEPATVTLTVLPVNDRPAALPQAASGAEDTALAVTLAATDIEGDTLAYTVTVPPAHGTLSGTAPDLTYQPSPDWHGTDSFSFTASDAALTSPPEIVLLTIAPVNDAPTALPAAVQTDEDTVLPITLTGTDIDGDLLGYTISTPPAHGTLSGVLPNTVYTPAADFHGTDEFTFTVNDGSAAGSPAIVSIRVLSVNDAPVAQSQTVSTAEDSALIIPLGGTDTEGDPLTWSITGLPAHGSASLDGNLVTYTPDENYNGPDSFAFELSDGSASHTALVAITVTSVNDAPVTWFDVFSVNEDTLLTVTASRRVLLNDSDLHGGAAAENNTPLTAALADAPAHAASFTLNPNGTFSYQPRPDFYGLDSFTYRSVDALGAASEPETVLIAVRAVNDAPVAAPQSVTTLEDVPRSIHLQSSDADVPFANSINPGPAPHDTDPSYTIVTAPQHGTLTGAAPHLIYTPAADYHGADSFAYSVSDGLAVSNTATVSIAIQADNDGDELPDSWEMANFGNLNSSSSDDPDLDGQNNAFELLSGNSPADGGESLTVELASAAGQGTLRLNRVRPGVVYVLESSHDLTTWDRLSETIYEAPGPGALHDERTNLSEQRRCFYRVTIEPAPN